MSASWQGIDALLIAWPPFCHAGLRIVPGFVQSGSHALLMLLDGCNAKPGHLFCMCLGQKARLCMHHAALALQEAHAICPCSIMHRYSHAHSVMHVQVNGCMQSMMYLFMHEFLIHHAPHAHILQLTSMPQQARDTTTATVNSTSCGHKRSSRGGIPVSEINRE